LDENNINIEEYRDNFYLRFINENRITLGENWCNLEIMISQLAEAIFYFKNNKEELLRAIEEIELGSPIEYSEHEVVFWNIFSDTENYLAKEFIAWTFFELNLQMGWEEMDVNYSIDKFNEEFINQLELLTELLEIYLSYRDYIDFEIDKIHPVETALDAIDDISASSVISFNYTHTPYKLYRIPIENTHYIHGEIDLSRHKSEINTMVFGIEDKENDVNSSLIPYQKYYQRIVKETGSKYEDFFKPRRAEDLYSGLRKKNIIVFGHSVDPLDKEIFQKCFALTNNFIYKYRFIFTYYNKSAKRSIIKNLAIILGKDKLVELTGNKNVVFVKSDNIDGMREVLSD
ncbi:MAG: AbiH family protein, partial [Intestinibacter bartlettii]|uniref:AbiH family protein n=1 Tax=Intestinibacter bartlettii TaxID=261299 RepID=UPI00399FA0CE